MITKSVDELESAVDFLTRKSEELSESEKSQILRLLHGEPVKLSKKCQGVVNEFREWIKS